MESNEKHQKAADKDEVRWQDYAASPASFDTSKIEDITTKTHRVIGYYVFVGPRLYIAFDCDWNRIGVCESMDDAKRAVVKNDQRP